MMSTCTYNFLFSLLFAALATILFQPVSGMMNGTMTHNNNSTMNHTMGSNHTMGGHGNHSMHKNNTMGGHGNHTMGGHGNHTMGGHGNHTMGGHGNHTMHNNTMGGHGNHSNHGNNGTGHDHNGNSGTDHSGHTGHTASGHGTYFITTEHLTLFFEGWTSDSKKDFTVMCVILGLIGILYEGLKLCRQYLTKAQMATSIGSNETKSYGDHSYKKSSTSQKICLHLLQTGLHTIQIFIGYLLMLGFMTFNTYICVSIMAGFAIGFLCFGWVLPAFLLSEDPDACCS